MDGLYAELAKLGLAGIFIVYLIHDNRTKAAQIEALQKSLTVVQEKRIEENRETGEIIRGNMTALASLTTMVGSLLKSRRG